MQELEQNQLYVSKKIQKNEWYTNLVKCELEISSLYFDYWHFAMY